MKTRIARPATRAALVALGAALALGACGRSGETPAVPAPAPAPPAADAVSAPAPTGPLAGTSWRLLEIQSMDDAQGTTRPDDPSKFTMTLNADGTVAMSLDCNKANGTWKAQPAADGTSGTFEFGPLAGTRALCPPPNLDEKITGQAQYIRGFLLKDGRLHLSLMADGGIWVFEPAGAPTSAAGDPALEAAILAASPSYTRAVVETGGGVGKGRYAFERVDLNGDGREEVLVYLLGSVFCGTGGCNLLVLSPDGKGGYTLVDDFPITQTPVIVSETRTNGWNDLYRSEAGGGAPASFVHHTFDGKKYVERQRLPAAPAPAGTPRLAGEVTFEKGIPLEPKS